MHGNECPEHRPHSPRAHPFARGLALAALALLPPRPARADAVPVVTRLIPPWPQSAEEITCGGTPAPPPHLLPEGIRFTAPFAADADRVYWDIPLPRMPPRATSLLLDLACADPGAVRAVSVHLQAGAGWYSAEAAPPASTNRQTIALPREAFRAEGAPAAWHRARRLRLSLWKRADRTATVTLHAVAARRDVVAVVRGGEATAPGEAPFARQMADRAGALLSKAGIPFTVIGDTFDEEPDTLRLLLLPWSPTPDARRLRRLDRFVRAGGRLIVFYNASAPLAESLGFTVGPWQSAPAGHAWAAWTNAPAAAEAPPLVVPHRTANLLPPRPAAGAPFGARAIALWTDASGRPTDLPACVLSSRGAWFAHVPPLATASACDFMRYLVTRLLPDLGGTLAHPGPGRSATLAAAAPPAAGEIRAVWETGAGRRPSQIEPLFAELARRKINTVYYHMQSGGNSHVESADHLLAPRLSDLLPAAVRHGIALHAWVTCWSLDEVAAERRATLAAGGRLMRDAQGNDLPWLCPSHPENQKLVLAGIASLASNGVHGIHLDYIRYPEQGCYAAATRAAFERFQGEAAGDWPRAVLPGGASADAFQTFRREEIARFVKATADTARQFNPGIVLSAAVFPDPATARSLGQEWPAWLREKSVDYVCPMAYTENAATFAAWIDACRQAAPGAADRLVAGLGTGADESQLDLTGVAEQIAAARARRLKGFAFFAVDSELLGRILPALDLAPQASDLQP